MIPAKFDYVRPGSLDEAVRALADGGEDAKIIAGGQSLLPLLRLRLAYPELLVDLAGLDELRGVTDAGDSLLIGARTTHYQLVHNSLVTEHCGLLAQATSTVADPPSGPGVRSAARSCTRTRQATCPRWRWRWMPRWSPGAPAASARSPRRTSSSTT